MLSLRQKPIIIRVVMSVRDPSYECSQVIASCGDILKTVMKSLLSMVWVLFFRNWEVLSSIYGNSSDAEYIIEQELTFVFHLDGLKGIVMYLIEPPGGIFSSLVVGDRFHVQDSLSDNVKNVFLKLWPPETDKAVWSIKFCPSLPWVFFQVISLQIRCGVFNLGTRASCRSTTLIYWSNVCGNRNSHCRFPFKLGN